MSHPPAASMDKGDDEWQSVNSRDSDGEERKENKAAANSAAVPLSASSSAAAAPSAASVASSSSHARGEVEEIVCSACHQSFECADDSARLPRTLPCGHLLCAACIKKQLQIKPEHVTCPLNQEHGEQRIRIPDRSASPSTVEDLIRSLPPALELIAAIRNQQRLLTRIGQQGSRCSHAGCEVAVSHFCLECGDLCSTHERKLHALSLFQSHKQSTVLIAQKAAALQGKFAGPAATIRAQIAASAASTQSRGGSAHATPIAGEAERATDRGAGKALEALKLTAEQMRASDDSTVLEMEADRLEAGGQPYRLAFDSTVLSALPANRVADLQAFLGAARSLAKAKLIYRASRDGFAKEDWFRQCGGKSNLLTLVKVKRNGFVFGAFTPFQWPVGVPTDEQRIADPSGTTFLFSLVNGHDRAVKLRLKESAKARAGKVYPGCGPIFGLYDAGLMFDGKSADTPEGSWTNPYSFDRIHCPLRRSGD